ncbi:hypothetical protein MRB53_038461 [Persea americana]|nr:hypothetical protein MRB53_038461 [Persea americana]
MFGEIVEVRTSDGGSFFLHRGALKFYSGYFAGAFREDAFKEGREGVIDLPSPTKLIGKFVHWMYTRQLSRGGNMRRKLALFAVEHHVPMLLNMLMDAIHDDFVRTGRVQDVPDVYEHTVGQPNTPDALPIPESYKLRQFAISTMCMPNQEMHTFMPWIDRWWPKDAVGDLLLARSRWSDSGKSKNFSPIRRRMFASCIILTTRESNVIRGVVRGKGSGACLTRVRRWLDRSYQPLLPNISARAVGGLRKQFCRQIGLRAGIDIRDKHIFGELSARILSIEDLPQLHFRFIIVFNDPKSKMVTPHSLARKRRLWSCRRNVSYMLPLLLIFDRSGRCKGALWVVPEDL